VKHDSRGLDILLKKPKRGANTAEVLSKQEIHGLIVDVNNKYDFLHFAYFSWKIQILQISLLKYIFLAIN